MWTLDTVLDLDAPCASLTACYSEQPDGTRTPCESAARSKDCNGTIPAGDPHFDEIAGYRGGYPFADVTLLQRRYCRHCVREMNDRCDRSGPILVRVELTFSDGTARYLEGDAAGDYEQRVTSDALMAYAHGDAGKELPWKVRTLADMTPAEQEEMRRRYEGRKP